MSTWAHKYNAYRVQIVIIYLHVLFHKTSIALLTLSTILLSYVLFVLTWYDFEHKFTASCLCCWSTTDRALAKHFWDYDYSAKSCKDYCVKNNNIDTRLILKSWLSLKKKCSSYIHDTLSVKWAVKEYTWDDGNCLVGSSSIIKLLLKARKTSIFHFHVSVEVYYL